MATSYAARVAGRASGSGGGSAGPQPTNGSTAVNGGPSAKPTGAVVKPAASGPSYPAPGGIRSTVGFNVANERLAFVGNVLVGYRVEVQVRLGAQNHCVVVLPRGTKHAD